MRPIFLIIAFLFAAAPLLAQQMPVQVTTVLTPPYTSSLSKMAESGSTSLMANIYVRDLTAKEIPVRLHISLKTNNITIESAQNIAVQPLFLGGGETRVLTGDDFAPYLRLENLVFKGHSKDSYAKTGALPGGLWKVSITVKHFYTGKTLSNVGTAMAWMTSYAPPVLEYPKNDVEAPANQSLPIIFSWQASKSMGGTTAILYNFELWEMRVDGVPAQAVVASIPPIFTTQTSGLSHTLIPASLAMEPGMKYCWRVTATDPSGQVQIQDGGHSEVRTFQYLHRCPEVCGLEVVQRDMHGQAKWEANQLHVNGWNVELYDDGGTYHETMCTSLTETANFQFDHSTTWHVRVQGLCSGDLTSEWSDWVDFTIPDKREVPTQSDGSAYECGLADPREITNFEEREVNKGDTILTSTGQTQFVIYSATRNDDGSYRGLSHMLLNIWGGKVIGVYDHLRVNTDGVLLPGSTWRSQKSTTLLITKDPIAAAKAAKAWIDSLEVEIASTTYNNTIRDTVKLQTATFVTIEREGRDYYAVDDDGNRTKISHEFLNSGTERVLVQDQEGNELVLDKDGNVMGVEEYKKCGGSKALLNQYNARKESNMPRIGTVTFDKLDGEKYGFDAWQGNDYDRNVYPTITSSNDYRPAYISIVSGQKVQIKPSQTLNITFKNEHGVPLVASDGTITYSTNSIGDQAIYAYSDTTIVGKLCIQAYDVKEVKVHVVRVNNGKQLELNKIADEVNRIYSSAVVHYTFDELAPITIEYANKKHFVHGGKGTFQNYNADQKTAIKALPENADGNDYYLFFTECYNRLDTAGNASPEAVNGYMPVGRHYGFIYNEYTNARTIAHELGHGTNALHHTFSQESESFYTIKETDNLMDYHAGEYLNHRQWQWTHEKHRNVLGFLDDEGESEARNNDNERILSILKEIREANQKDEAMLNISVNQSMTYTIDVPNTNFTLGEGTLSYLKIENDKLSITETETTIAPNELSEVVLEDKEYTKIVFHKTTSVGISEDIAFSIIVKTKEKQTLISYIHPYKITTEQLSNIYPNASTQTIKAVTEAINKYCNEFEINTPERMAHFLGQIGAETGDKLNKLSESSSYTARRIVEIFGDNKYGHLFEEAVLDETTYNYSYIPIDYSCSSCRTGAIDKGNSTFSMDETKIINAYAEIKEEKEVVINGQKVKKMLFNETPRTDVVREGENKTISKYVSNESYSDGRLRVKKQYIKSATLFDVTYACRMGNGAIETRDGSVYAGVGFIHLTGKSNYNDVIDFWNKMHPDDKLTLNHELIERAKTDVDLAMMLAMAYWKFKRVNKSVKSKTYNESESNKISYEINGGTNGRDSRQKNTKKAFDVLSK